MTKNAYDFEFQHLSTGAPLALDAFKGKVILVVNTASRCGLTPQYAELEALSQHYAAQGLVVIGVPCNDFADQEPASAEVIQNFCQQQYGVSFLMTQKISLLGKTPHPFYAWARHELGWWAYPKWNFHKYLIDRQGKLRDYFYSFTSVNNPRFIKVLDKLIAAT